MWNIINQGSTPCGKPRYRAARTWPGGHAVFTFWGNNVKSSALAVLRGSREETETEANERLTLENRKLRAENAHLRQEVARRDDAWDALGAVVSNPPFRSR